MSFSHQNKKGEWLAAQWVTIQLEHKLTCLCFCGCYVGRTLEKLHRK